MARTRSSRSRKESLTSFKDLAGVDIRVIGTTRASGSGSRVNALTRQDFLRGHEVNPIFKEKINHPIEFDLKPADDDEDDDIWPPYQRKDYHTQGSGVVLLPGSGDRINKNPNTETDWDQAKIHASIAACKEAGFVQGAIVAHRPLLASGNDWKVKLPVYWGFITSLNTYIPGQQYKVYAPIHVRWFVPSNHANYVEEKLFPGDLYLIHAALSEEAIVAKMKAQQL